MQTLRKKTSPCKYRNDPGRFFGDGVQFKAKLIGILEVGEARGDRMCQEALQDLKMAIRAAGEHKQRITIHVTIDGLRLRDEKTGDSLYHHPVHKISFIAQDMTDSRAFGYIFGSPDSGHRFFGIKTDKAASQVVLAMRDLFQVVFELKKKEIELARQQIQSKSIHHHDQHQLSSLSSLKSAAGGGGGQNDLSGLGGGSSTSAATLSMLNTMVSSSTNTPAACRLGFNMDSKGASKEISPESVADLVDLEQELNSLQRGINQMERITPNDGTVSKSSIGGSGGNDDPFGDSFSNFPTLPPPEPGRLRSKATTKSIDLPTSTNSATSALLSPSATRTTKSPIQKVGLSASAPPMQPLDDDDNWLRELDAHNDVFDTSKAMMPGLMGMQPPLASTLSSSIPLTTTRAPLATRESTETPPSHIYETVSCSASAVPEANELSIAANNTTPNAELNTMANSPSLNDIFQTTVTTEASKLDIKSDAFTDLDPLGTGRIRPYVDKKYFFQELKNPPKKVLKDLTAANHSTLISSSSLTTTTTTATATTITAPTTATATTSISSLNASATTAANSMILYSMSDSRKTTDDILNLEEFELKTHQSTTTTTTTTNNQTNFSYINSILTTSTLTPVTATSFMATGTNATYASVYNSHASMSNVMHTSTNAAPTVATLSQRAGSRSSSYFNQNYNQNNNNNTALICTCPTSILVTCTITNASTNRLTNQIPNNSGINHLLTQSMSSSGCGGGVSSASLGTSGSFAGGGGILAPKVATAAVSIKQTAATIDNSSQPLTQTNSLRFSRYPPPLETLEQSSAIGDAVMLPRDTDPFSPTRKKSDPFEEGGDLFSKLDPFEFEFNNTERDEEKGRDLSGRSPPPKDFEAEASSQVSQDILATGQLQVSLPPEGAEMPQPISTVRSRPIPSNAMSALPLASGPLPPASLLKQQTADVISSISNKKMPHLFGQSSRFPKRDSNSINMRRLQESDSLSETETAPEPPPRPDSATYIEPPPLPPKKQFNDIIIRPRIAASQGSSSANRYESALKIGSTSRTSPISNAIDVPPIPLPSRRVARTDGSYPGPGRPRKPGHTEDDYLAPLGGIISGISNVNVSKNPDVPPLLPPPTQNSSRARTQRQQSFSQASKPNDIYENKQEILQQQLQQQKQKQLTEPSIVPDITLSQLLTLGIDELSVKLNVPTSKLSTMTLVELTSYLSEFLEKSKPEINNAKSEEVQGQPLVFKVNFDQEATFVAKFDDTFGEDFHQTSSSTFEANFAQFDRVNVEAPGQRNLQNSHVPPADRYAVFREIIDQELQQQQQEVDLIGDVMEDNECMSSEEKQFDTKFTVTTDLTMKSAQHDLLSGDMPEVTGPQPSKIDTKISEVLAQAKDRYAALRDLILVENIFVQPQIQPPAPEPEDDSHMRPDSKSPFHGFSGFNDDDDDQDLKQLMDQDISMDPSAQQQRLGLVDSRGLLVEPSSSAITVEDDEDDELCIGGVDKEDQGGLSSADSNEKEQDKDNLPVATYEQLASSNQQLEDIEEKQEKYEDTPKISITQSQSNADTNYLSVGSVASSGLSGSKDDLEIDDLMQRAISNLSLDSRDRNSPAVASHLLTTSGGHQQTTNTATTTMTPPHFNDVSTSPIPPQRSPAPSITTQAKSSSNKSPQQMSSPLPSQLTVVSQIIDNATRQIQDTVSKTSNESWATFDTPQHQPVATDKRARPSAKAHTKAGNFLNLPPPPGSTSNCSQNDSALESPCSSEPRDEAWHKHTMGGSSLSLGHNSVVGSTSGQRHYHKKDRQNTSSSSRDLSWDEDQGVVGSAHILDYPPSKRVLSGQSQGSHTTERMGYYRRHARRMNSCDEDYDYDQDIGTIRGRDHCKHKRNISRSRDNFDMDSPGWYHHHGVPYPHHTWSSQDIDQVRGRSFDRAAYERTTYGPPIYDKRGVGPSMPPPTSSGYDRRIAGGVNYEKRSKYFRGETSTARSSNVDRMYTLDDFETMAGKIPPHLAGMYEEMKTECFSPQQMAVGSHRQRITDYMYERERKSFDRESLESYEGSNLPPRRRRRSYDSGGDPYASCDSRDDYHRDRCVMTADKSRSLRKSLKSLRVSGDIDYEQDSEKDYHYRDQRTRCDTRSLQRPSQLSTQGTSGSITGMGQPNSIGSQLRVRKSSGSSPWDGEEPPIPGPKTSASSWKRPSSAADAERRLPESRRSAVKGQTPSGSEDDKDRRYRKKRGSRNKDMIAASNRYREGIAMRGGNYDYITCGDLDDDAEDYVDEEEEEDPGMDEDENSPADEDKFARLEMRRHEMHNRMMDAHVRRRKDGPPATQMISSYRKSASGSYGRKPLPPTETKHIPQDYGYDDDGEYEQTPTPRSNTSSALPTATPNASTKFSFDVGFESDFNQSSPPPAPAGTASSCNSTPAASVSAANTPASKSSFRFSNDYQNPAGSLQQYELENRGDSPQVAITHNTTPKLRFDDNVKISQFDDAFEDDFSKATFDTFEESKDQWQESLQRTTKQQIRNNKLQQRQQDLIKKSESINIFAKKVDDPFEDDDFFNSPSSPPAQGEKKENHRTSSNTNSFNQQQQWDDNTANFAKFDENM